MNMSNEVELQSDVSIEEISSSANAEKQKPHQKTAANSSPKPLIGGPDEYILANPVVPTMNDPIALLTKLKIYSVSGELPKITTDGSACMDVKAHLLKDSYVTSYDEHNNEQRIKVEQYVEFEYPAIKVNPRCRVMVPTGLFMDIPHGYSVRMHSRSGLALKNHLVLANGEAVIDSDYIHEVFVILANNSNQRQFIQDGARIAQMELVKNCVFEVVKSNEKPKQKTKRDGGFGSTGV